MFIGFGILPSLSWGRNISSIYTEDSSIDKDGEIYSFPGPIGHVDPGDFVGAICLILSQK